jgi:hypothetical protein
LKRAGTLLLLLVSCFLAVAIIEAVLRIARFDFPFFYEYHDVLGYHLAPGRSGRYHEEGGSQVAINRDGLRDREHQIAKPENTYRIAILGDSFAEAKQVSYEDAFWHVLEKELGRCPEFAARNVEVINFGVSGYGTGQQWQMLQEKVWKYAPDLVILAFFTHNDISDNVRELSKQYYGFEREDAPFFSLENGAIQVSYAFRKKSGAKPKSAVWQLYYRLRNQLHSVRLLSKVKNNLIYGSENTFEKHSHLVYEKPQDPTWREAWSLTEKLLLTINAEAAQRKAKFFLVILSNSIQVHPDPQVREEFKQRYGIADLLYPDRRLTAFGAQHGIMTLALAPILQKKAEKEGIFFHGFPNTTMGKGHWNAQAHHFAGKIIAEQVCKAGNDFIN